MNIAVPLKKIPVIKLVLLIRNKSVKQLSEHVGVARPYVSTWVNGHDEPSREQADKIARFLDWDIKEIWDDDAPLARKKRASKDKIGKAKLVDEGALKVSDATPPDRTPDRHLHAVPSYDLVSRWLDPVPSIEDGPETVDIYSYVAAGGLEDPETEKEATPARIPFKKIRGAKAFGVRVRGDSMVNAGIDTGDILFVRRSSSRPDDEAIVLVLQDAGTTVKRLRGKKLIAESDTHQDIELFDQAALLGVAYHIHKPKR